MVARPGGMGAENGRHAFLDLDRPDIPDEPWNPGLGLPDSPRSTRESAATGRSTPRAEHSPSPLCLEGIKLLTWRTPFPTLRSCRSP